MSLHSSCFAFKVLKVAPLYQFQISQSVVLSHFSLPLIFEYVELEVPSPQMIFASVVESPLGIFYMFRADTFSFHFLYLAESKIKPQGREKSRSRQVHSALIQKRLSPSQVQSPLSQK